LINLELLCGILKGLKVDEAEKIGAGDYIKALAGRSESGLQHFQNLLDFILEKALDNY